MKKVLRIVLTSLLLAAFGASVFCAAPALAQTLSDAEMFGGGLSGSEFAQLAGLGGGDIRVVIARLIRTVLSFLGIVTVGIILYGGFVYIMSKGEPAKVDKAKQIITNGVIGLVIVFSSFAITQFVLNSLVNAIKAGERLPDHCIEYPEDPACTRRDPDPLAGRFVMEYATTDCAESLRNPLIEFGFNLDIDASSIMPDGGLAIYPQGVTTAVAGTWTVSGRTAEFTPSATCEVDVDNPAVPCFAANTAYTIKVDNVALRSATDIGVTACTLNDFVCSGDALNFTTGEGFDLTSPTVAMQDPQDGDSAYSGRPEPLQASTLDDSGVAAVEFYVAGGVEDTAGIADSLLGEITPAPAENYFNGTWQTMGYVIGQTYSLWAVGSDCGGNVARSESVEIPLRAPNCDNSVQDSGTPYFETGIDCGGQGQYFCGKCPDEVCTKDADCASGECDEAAGVCVAVAEIEAVSPGNGAAGNLVTIIGNGFGATPGTVTFYGLDDDATDDVGHVPFTSAQCASTWSDDEVVVQVGSADLDGPIGIVTAAGKADRTDDDAGALIRDFDVNDIVRPGICQLNPTSGLPETQTVVGGVNLGAGDGSPLFYLGLTASETLANWNAGVSFSALVPLIDSGIYKTQYFYGEGADREGSNALSFEVLALADETEPPVISQIDSGITACTGTTVACDEDADCVDGGTCSDEAGPIGQYLTIYGTNFGEVLGAVLFENNVADSDSQGFSALGDSDFPAYCDVDFWSDDMIVVKVPETYNLDYDVLVDAPLPFEAGAHELWIERGTDGIDSARIGFTVLDGEAGPSICGITPDSGPVNTMVTIMGERFGSEADGSVTFTDAKVMTKSLTQPVTWSDTSVIGFVPNETTTGPVYVTSLGNNSNSVNYAVGVCDEDFTCGAGEECCTDGSCALEGECALPPGEAYYTYFFSTSEIPVAPTVVTGCTPPLMSPTPWVEYDEKVCLNAAVSATFSTAMDEASLTSGNISVVNVATNEPVPMNGEPVLAATNTGGTMFEWDPLGTFAPDSHFRVTLNGGEEAGAIKSAEGAYLTDDYTWDFYTASSGTMCVISEVHAIPESYTATVHLEKINYSVLVEADAYECVAMACTSPGLSWTWSQNPTNKSRFVNKNGQTLNTPTGCLAREEAMFNTAPNTPVIVSPRETSSGAQGAGALTIAFEGLQVTDYFPDCGSTCTNATPWVEFNVPMNTAYLNSSSFSLYKCSDALCDPSQQIPVNKVSTTYNYNSATLRATITPSVGLLPDTYYRVIVSGWLRVGWDTTLAQTGANYGSNFSWVFRTTDTACAVDRIGVWPEEQIFTRINERGEFSAAAYSAPDECASEGQMLNAAAYTWDPWTVDNANIADVWNRGTKLDLLPSWCTSECLHSGSASMSAVCGNNTIESPEDCDGGNATSGDGCSSSCLTEGVVGGTCGNLSKTGREECDDGKTCANGQSCTSDAMCSGIGDAVCKVRDGDGCSAACLNEGIIPASVCAFCECGNGVVDHSNVYGGEECDDGNTAPGDGCSSSCLHEGSEAKTSAVCGRYGKEAGEDCDDDNTASGDGCSEFCLNEGTAACAQSGAPNCCGNGGLPETGEDCDDGNKVAGDGCSENCLNEGSSYLYTPISVCGDATLGKGEECEASGSVGAAGPYAITTIKTTAPSEVDLTTNTAETALNASVAGKTGEATLILECACSSDASCSDNPPDVSLYGCGEANCCYERPEVVTGGMVPANATGVCRNAAVSVTFNQDMDDASFLDVDATTVDRHLYLQLLGFDADKDGVLDHEDANGNGVLDAGEDANGNGVLDAGEEVRQNTCPSSHEVVVLGKEERNVASSGGLPEVLSWLANGITRVLFNQASALVPSAVICILPTDYTLEDDALGGSQVYLRYNEALQSYGIYQLVAEGQTSGVGVKSVYGVEMYEPESTVFVTKDEICTLDYVEVEDQGKQVVSEFEDPSSGLFTELEERHTLTASAYSLDGAQSQAIIGIPGVYDWSWSWSGTDDAVIDVPTEPTVATNTATSASNGEITALATANVSDGSQVRGDVRLIAFLCEDPWPADLDLFPFADDAAHQDAENGMASPWTNFSFSYCRDDQGLGLLPEIEVVQAPGSPNPEIVKEMLFIVSGTGDALGVRVQGNEDLLPVSRWYEEQGFTSAASDTVLDGYQALRSGTTLYVNAANDDGANIWPNIYVISYNEDASEESKAIFEQILANWQFNANSAVVTDFNVCFQPGQCSVNTGTVCSVNSDCTGDETCRPGYYLTDVKTHAMLACDWDEECRAVTYSDGTTGTFPNAYCDAEKAKLTRDLTRLTDLRDMELTIEAYGDVNRHCSVTKGESCASDGDCPGTETCLDTVPGLPSGSFVREFTTSVWPSWTAVLGNELGTALPVDPINEFVACSNDPAADETTCFSQSTGVFSCHEGSHAYIYQNIGGEAYNLSGQLEYDEEDAWVAALDTDSSDTGTLATEADTVCDGTLIGESEICGDGILGRDDPSTQDYDGEICEIGQTISDADLAALNEYSVTSPCRVCVNYNNTDEDGTSCTANSDCGTADDGTIGTDYFCAEGTTTYACANFDGVCDWDDAGPSACIPYECGNGVVDPGETCDDGYLNGAYGYCDDNCTLIGAFFCGDGSIAGGEECDCGEDSDAMDAGAWSANTANCSDPNGQYADAYDTSCAFDCSFPGPSCGDNLVNGDEECDGEIEQWAGALCADGSSCETDDDCDDSSDCGDGGVECGSSKTCLGGNRNSRACSSDSDCTGGGTCSAFVYDLSRYRSCLDPGDADECEWDAWSACKGGSQVCGNGNPEGNEECDDGDADETDECTSACKRNVCGDGSMYIGIESCDDGAGNGAACTPEYGDTCVYCSVNCQFTTVSGAFCGDAEISGNELCDTANVSNYCYVGNSDPEQRSVGTTCSASAPCAAGTGTCEVVGVCNGGSKWNGSKIIDFNGAPCLVGDTGATSYCGESNETYGTEAGECVAYECADDCASSCPEVYESSQLDVQSEEAGAAKTDSVTLYSYLSGQSPDQAVVNMPACEVGVALTADVEAEAWEGPSADIVFVTDWSGSMSEALGGSTRIQVAADAITSSVETLFDAFSGNPSQLKVGTVSYTTTTPTGLSVDDACVKRSSGTSGLAWVNADLGSSESDILYDPDMGVAEYPLLIGGWTPTAAGLRCAGNMLIGSSGDRKIVILLSDGEPTAPIDQALNETDEYLGEIVDVRADLLAQGIEVYTVALTDTASLQGWMAHFSSDACTDMEPGGPVGACTDSATACTVTDDCEGTCRDKALFCTLGDDTTCNEGGDIELGNCRLPDPYTRNPEIPFYLGDCITDDDCSGYCYEDPSTNCVTEYPDCVQQGDEYPYEDYHCIREEGRCENPPETYDICVSAGQTCDNMVDDFDQVSDCAATDDVEYAYSADTAEELTAMYNAILQTILTIQLTFTYELAGDTVTTHGGIVEGTGVILPFPVGFACKSEAFGIPLRLSYDGEGAVTLSNFQLRYCPAE